jgi:hypothetical protein
MHVRPEVIATLRPTTEGERRYASIHSAEPAGYFNGCPCTCDMLCVDHCRGECGCPACAELAKFEPAGVMMLQVA